VKQIVGLCAIALVFGVAGANAEARTGRSSIDGSELPIAAGCASLALSWYELRVIPSEVMDPGPFFMGTGDGSNGFWVRP
jgi:hypothetical protein